jgi:hypothetical protein
LSERPPRKRRSTISAAFGAKNRARLLTEYFAGVGSPSADNAWRHVYALLLWIDRTTGLAHCYESDKTQPGKHWYPRSLAFHDWLAGELEQAPSDLANSLDWLFRRATLDLVEHLLARQAAVLARAKAQRAPYEGRGFPIPGEDPELVSVIQEVLGEYLASPLSDEKWRELVQRVRQHVALENKRKNLVGEGFEDVIAAIVSRATKPGALRATARQILQTVPGFANERQGDKPNKVDVVLLHDERGTRTLVTAKWSIRADREKQFQAEFSSYVAAKSDLKPFEYVLVTNEFDPARLVRACEAMAANTPMFTSVVHISTDALRAVYGKSPEDSMEKVIGYIERGRLIDLRGWLATLGV